MDNFLETPHVIARAVDANADGARGAS